MGDEEAVEFIFLPQLVGNVCCSARAEAEGEADNRGFLGGVQVGGEGVRRFRGMGQKVVCRGLQVWQDQPQGGRGKRCEGRG